MIFKDETKENKKEVVASVTRLGDFWNNFLT